MDWGVQDRTWFKVQFSSIQSSTLFRNLETSHEVIMNSIDEVFKDVTNTFVVYFAIKLMLHSIRITCKIKKFSIGL